MGLLLILLFVGTALDIAYMCNPLLQTSMDKFLDGKRAGGFRLISKDAVLAREEAYTNSTHVLICYLRRRIKTYIIASLVIYLLYIGPGPIVMYLWNLLVPIFKGMGLLT